MSKQFFRRLADAGWVPHAGQRAYLDSNARFRVLACGRRWGKTDATAADMARRVFLSRRSRQIAIAPTLAQARIVFERMKWMLTAVGVAYTAVQTPHPTIRVHEGGKRTGAIVHVFDARSGHEAHNLRGDGADHILLDEAAFVPEELITEVAMPMLAANDGRMTLISTPRGRNFFYRLFRMGERGENGFWSRRSPSSENPRVSAEYLALQREILSERSFRTEYEAEFLDATTTVFAYEALERAMSARRVDVGEVVVGVDWARCEDFTAAVAVRGLRSRCEVVDAARWSGLGWAAMVSRVTEFATRHAAHRILCDATGVGDPVTEQLRSECPGLGVEGFVFTQSSKADIIELLAWGFERGTIRLLPDPDLVRELEHFEGKGTARGRVVYGAVGGYHDDLVCALALAYSALGHSRSVGVAGRTR